MYVVNCFQIVFLLWSLTTIVTLYLSPFLLWIAFKLYFYCGLWQLDANLKAYIIGCELLSNCIFTVVFDNNRDNYKEQRVVVNCFQIVFLLWSLTTSGVAIGTGKLLWIAFKLYFYCGLWQPFLLCLYQKPCCELLSNCIFTVVFDNEKVVRERVVNVVNCFQIVFLLWSLTTNWFEPCHVVPLWIAFKLYFYCGLWQLILNF